MTTMAPKPDYHHDPARLAGRLAVLDAVEQLRTARAYRTADAVLESLRAVDRALYDAVCRELEIHPRLDAEDFVATSDNLMLAHNEVAAPAAEAPPRLKHDAAGDPFVGLSSYIDDQAIKPEGYDVSCVDQAFAIECARMRAHAYVAREEDRRAWAELLTGDPAPPTIYSVLLPDCTTAGQKDALRALGFAVIEGGVELMPTGPRALQAIAQAPAGWTSLFSKPDWRAFDAQGRERVLVRLDHDNPEDERVAIYDPDAPLL